MEAERSMALYKAGSQFNYHSAEALPRPNSMKQRAGLDFTQLAQAVLHLVVPSCIFLFTSSLLSFHVHFDVGAGLKPHHEFQKGCGC